MGCAFLKQNVRAKAGTALDPKRKIEKGDVNLPPLKNVNNLRSAEFGKLPDSLTPRNKIDEKIGETLIKQTPSTVQPQAQRPKEQIP